MSGKIYIEGGGDSKELHSRCREGFRKLLEKCGAKDRMPKLIACGGRNAAFDGFSTAHRNNHGNVFVALLVDSEDPVVDIEQTWAHLKTRDPSWTKPSGAIDDQVLLMTTCMETWIISDHVALRKNYPKLKEASLLPLNGIEMRNRHEVQAALTNATASCTNAYLKGKRSFEILSELTPSELRDRLPSFKRFERLLRDHL